MGNPLTVGQLVAILATVPQDAMIVIRGYEGGFDSAKSTRQLNVIRDPQPWCGEYNVNFDELPDGIEAVLITAASPL